MAVSSSKSMTGHMLQEATGAVESIVCALSIRDNIIPPTINYKTPDQCDLDYVPNIMRASEVNAALNNSLSLVVIIQHCVLQKHVK